MRTWGIDWSTSAANTAAVCVAWGEGGTATIDRVVPSLSRSDAVDLIVDAVAADEWVAVDVPFGWLTEFVEVVARHQAQQPIEPRDDPDSWRKERLALRETDRWVVEQAKPVKVRPLSVAFDKLGATAMSWAVVEDDVRQRGIKVDRAGVDGRILETYPAAARMVWQGGRFPVEQLLAALTCLELGEFATQLRGPGNHVVDALVCALVAQARALGRTVLPTDQQLSAAGREGWIHLPIGILDDLVGPSGG